MPVRTMTSKICVLLPRGNTLCSLLDRSGVRATHCSEDL